MNKHILLIGGAALAGVAVLVLIMREHSASPQSGTYGPQPAQLPGVPQYPALPPLPPFTVTATPYYLTVNYPPDRNLTAPANSDAEKDGCGCKDKCKPLNTVTFTQPQLQAQAASARYAMNNGSGNLVNQFPPSDFPWLYSGGGAA